jgi:type VI secretion system secreted protein Hcp
MAIPSYLWLKDEGGADIKGSSRVHGREGSIEVLGFYHSLHIPTDGNTGQITGSRVHTPMHIEKEFDSASPDFYRAVSKGLTLRSAEIQWYQIDDSGREVEYFNMLIENIKIVSISPIMHNIKNPDTANLNHLERIEFRYEKITWKYCEGNICFSDSWCER